MLNLIKANKHVIKLEEAKQSFKRYNYNIKLIDLKNFKIYIKIYLINSFIRFWKLLSSVLILLICKSDYSYYLYFNDKARYLYIHIK